MCDKYFVFAYCGYEQSGGSGDCRGIFDTSEEAIAETLKYLSYDYVSVEAVRNNKFTALVENIGLVDDDLNVINAIVDNDKKIIYHQQFTSYKMEQHQRFPHINEYKSKVI